MCVCILPFVSIYKRDLNDSPISDRPSHRRRIAVDEPPAVNLGRIVGEQAEDITFWQERVKGLDEQIKTTDEQIISLVSRNTLLCAQKQTIEYKLANQLRDLASANENNEDLRRMIKFKNREISQHSAHLRNIVDEHSDRMAKFARRTTFAENQLKKLEAAWPAGVPMP